MQTYQVLWIKSSVNTIYHFNYNIIIFIIIKDFFLSYYTSNVGLLNVNVIAASNKSEWSIKKKDTSIITFNLPSKLHIQIKYQRQQKWNLRGIFSTPSMICLHIRIYDRQTKDLGSNPSAVKSVIFSTERFSNSLNIILNI